MLNAILGKKGKMGATYIQDTRIPVTWVKAGPCIVTQIKKLSCDGYWAAQIGFEDKKIKNISKPLQGHLKKISQISKVKSQKFFPRYLREIRTDGEPDVKVGDQILVSDLFKKGDLVAVSGISKGKGFAGVVKRWHFAGGPKTHGQSDRQRAPGSIGQGTTPGRVFKGKHMAGRMGGEAKTIKNLIVVDVVSEEGRIAISGSLPGSTDSLLVIKKIGSGKLEELVEETPEIQIHEGEGVTEGAEKESMEGVATESTEKKSGDTEKVKVENGKEADK
jgi:large subunit ribosomal protein L3